MWGRQVLTLLLSHAYWTEDRRWGHTPLLSPGKCDVIADSKGGDLQMGFCNTTFCSTASHRAASAIATTLAYPASMTTPSESGLTFTSDSVSLHPPPFFLCSPSITLPVQHCKLPLFFFSLLLNSPHFICCCFSYLSTCVGVAWLPLHKQSIHPQADVMLQGRVCSYAHNSSS